jgi:hypothetical protein
MVVSAGQGGWVFYLDTGAVGGPESAALGSTGIERLSNSTTVPAEGIRRNAQLALYNFISKLSGLPAGHPMVVEQEAANGALRVLDYLTSFEDEVPTVFVHGGDAVVLKWDGEEIARYLTIGGSDATLLGMRKSDPSLRCEAEYDLDDDGQREELLKAIGGVASAGTALADAS